MLKIAAPKTYIPIARTMTGGRNMMRSFPYVRGGGPTFFCTGSILSSIFIHMYGRSVGTRTASLRPSSAPSIVTFVCGFLRIRLLDGISVRTFFHSCLFPCRK